MKSIIVLSFFDPIPKSGVSVRVFEVTKNLALLGNKIFLIAPGEETNQLHINNLHVLKFRPPRYLKTFFIMYYLFKNAQKILTENKIDIIISEHLWSLLPALILKKLYNFLYKDANRYLERKKSIFDNAI